MDKYSSAHRSFGFAIRKKLNEAMSKLLIRSLLGILLVGIIIFFLPGSGTMKYYMLGALGICFILILIAFYISQKSTPPVIIELTDKKVKILIHILSPAVILLGIFVIPVSHFAFTAILIVLGITVSVYMRKSFVIDSRGMRYTCRWGLKWDAVDNYNLDKEHGILDIRLKNGVQRQLTGIKPDYYQEIEENIDNYLQLNSSK